jgi:hypothetical protein
VTLRSFRVGLVRSILAVSALCSFTSTTNRGSTQDAGNGGFATHTGGVSGTGGRHSTLGGSAGTGGVSALGGRDNTLGGSAGTGGGATGSIAGAFEGPGDSGSPGGSGGMGDPQAGAAGTGGENGDLGGRAASGTDAGGVAGAGASGPVPSCVDAGPVAVKAVAAGWSQTCALTTSGGVQCWGLNDGTTTGHSTRPGSDVLTGVQAIAVGTGRCNRQCSAALVLACTAEPYVEVTHTCALTTAGGVRCWGSNGSGQLGNGTTTDLSTPPSSDVLTSVQAIAAGVDHTAR